MSLFQLFKNKTLLYICHLSLDLKTHFWMYLRYKNPNTAQVICLNPVVWVWLQQTHACDLTMCEGDPLREGVV